MVRGVDPMHEFLHVAEHHRISRDANDTLIPVYRRRTVLRASLRRCCDHRIDARRRAFHGEASASLERSGGSSSSSSPPPASPAISARMRSSVFIFALFSAETKFASLSARFLSAAAVATPFALAIASRAEFVRRRCEFLEVRRVEFLLAKLLAALLLGLVELGRLLLRHLRGGQKVRESLFSTAALSSTAFAGAPPRLAASFRRISAFRRSSSAETAPAASSVRPSLSFLSSYFARSVLLPSLVRPERRRGFSSPPFALSSFASPRR